MSFWWQVRKETVKLLFVDAMISHTENPKESTKILLKLIKNFSKVAGYKSNRPKLIILLYVNNE